MPGRELIDALNGAGPAVTVLTSNLLEGYSLVLYRRGIQAAQRWSAEVEASASLLNPTADDYSEAVRLLSGYPDQPISLFDALLAAVARRLGLAVWTFDHQFDVMRVEVWRH